MADRRGIAVSHDRPLIARGEPDVLLLSGTGSLCVCGWHLTIIAAQRLALNLRWRLLRHLDMLSPAYHESNPVGASLYPLTEPVDEIASFGSDLVPSILRTVTRLAGCSTALTLVKASCVCCCAS
jgi:ABC-type transport system involved in cytochrome bd biosynthesis fused ATPase/permease subunit